MKEIRANYNPESIITPILEKYKADIERRMEVQKKIDEQGFVLRAEALLGRLASAVGWTMNLNGTIELSNENEGLVEDDFLERNFDTRQEEVDEVVFALNDLGINSERTRGIIDTMSQKLLKASLFYLPLIRQGYREYHEKQLAFFTLVENVENTDYHRKMLDRMGNWTVVNIAANMFFPGMAMFKENESDFDALGSFLEKLQDVDPDLKRDIIDGFKNPVEIEEPFETPF